MPAIYLALRETRSANLRGYSRSTVGWRKCQGNLVQSMPTIRIIVWRRDPTNYNTLLISCYAHRHSFCSPYSRVSCFIFWLIMLENEGYFFTCSLERLISFWSKLQAKFTIEKHSSPLTKYCSKDSIIYLLEKEIETSNASLWEKWTISFYFCRECFVLRDPTKIPKKVDSSLAEFLL